MEDILVKVGEKLVFPADFVIYDLDEDEDSPIILGRPFLAATQPLIDVEKGELIMQINNEKVTLRVFSNINNSSDVEECCSLMKLDRQSNLEMGRIEIDDYDFVDSYMLFNDDAFTDEGITDPINILDSSLCHSLNRKLIENGDMEHFEIDMVKLD